MSPLIKSESAAHKDLIQRAVKWLKYKKNLSVVVYSMVSAAHETPM